MTSSRNFEALKKILLARRGLFVPCENHASFLSDATLAKVSCDKIQINRVHPSDDQRISEAKNYFLRTFYKEAPIPRALKLGDEKSLLSYQNNPATWKFLDNELDMYLKSGASMIFRRPEDDEVIGVALSCLWSLNPSYEMIDESFDVFSWHNTAAQIAAEHPKSFERNLVWRDLQFQHLYNLSQRIMRNTNRTLTLYAGALYYDQATRDAGLTDRLLSTVANICDEQKAVLMTQSNFRGFDRFVERHFKRPVVVEFMKYDDEDLLLPSHNDDNILGQNEKCFKLLSKLDGIRFYADMGRNTAFNE